ncbi:MAG: hypothetical protein LBP63_01300 [Prevotellaceae bacterium]|nr:hypothetical protein [Prevotellaceae bacterium]
MKGLRFADMFYLFGNSEREMHGRFIYSEIPNERCTADLFIRKFRTSPADMFCRRLARLSATTEIKINSAA